MSHSHLQYGHDSKTLTGVNADSTIPVDTDVPVDSINAPNDRSSRPHQRDEEPLSLQWLELQASFVDEPRASVENAQQFVDGLYQEFINAYQNEVRRLQSVWNVPSGDNAPTTETLRRCLQRYRDLFQRLSSLVYYER